MSKIILFSSKTTMKFPAKPSKFPLIFQFYCKKLAQSTITVLCASFIIIFIFSILYQYY